MQSKKTVEKRKFGRLKGANVVSEISDFLNMQCLYYIDALRFSTPVQTPQKFEYHVLLK